MVIALTIIAVLLILAVLFLKKFMKDMADVEAELISQLKEIKGILAKISEKQL